MMARARKAKEKWDGRSVTRADAEAWLNREGEQTPSERQGPAKDLVLPSFEDKDWHDFGAIIDAGLDGKARAGIAEVAEQCVIARFFEEPDKQRRKQRGRVDSKGKTKAPTLPLKLRRLMDRLVEAWGAVQADPEARRAIENYSDEMAMARARDLDMVMADLQFHRIALPLFLAREKGLDPFIGFVGGLAAVYETAIGKPPKVAYPKDTEDPDAKVSPFVEFIMAVDACLPTSSRWRGVDSPAANSQAVIRALNKYKSEGCLPPIV